MPVCLGCGVLAPQQRTDCRVCGSALPPVDRRARVARLDGARYWVAVRCRFQCRVCGHLSPLDHLDIDGSVDCMSCGVAQAFDVDSWTDGLAHAHAIGDLSGPEPEGRFPGASVSLVGHNPHAAIGVTATGAEIALSGMTIGGGVVSPRSLRVDASPGHPLCQQCRTPLAVVGASADLLSMRCARCHESTRYQLPEGARALASGLRGAIAEEHREDRHEARIDRSAGGAIVIRCPNCSGAVSVTGASSIVDCQYCHVSLRIPNAAFHGLGRGVPKPLLWWLLFEGPSDKRTELLAGESGDADSAENRLEPRDIEVAPEGDYSPAVRFVGVFVPLAIFLAVGLAFFGERIRAVLDGL